MSRMTDMLRHEYRRYKKKLLGKNKPVDVTVSEHKLSADEIKNLGLPKREELEALLDNGYISRDEFSNLRSSMAYMDD